MFIWRDCPSGEWRLKTAAGGGTITYSGTVTAGVPYTSVKPVALSLGDVLDFTTNPQQIAFTFHTSGTGSDGVNFIPQDGTSACLQINAPGVSTVYFGPFRTPVSQPFDLDTQTTCP